MTKEQWSERQRQWKRFHAFERHLTRRMRMTRREAFRIFDELYQEARALGAFRGANRFTDIETQKQIASILNST